MPEFCINISDDLEFKIKGKEIREILQNSYLQGGSKYRQKDVYALLDRVVARGPVKKEV